MAEKASESVHDEVHTAIAAGAYQQALELLAHAYVDTVYRYCCRMLRGDTGRARDVTQQVYGAMIAPDVQPRKQMARDIRLPRHIPSRKKHGNNRQRRPLRRTLL